MIHLYGSKGSGLVRGYIWRGFSLLDELGWVFDDLRVGDWDYWRGFERGGE